MTKEQQNKINMIRKQAENLHGVNDKDYEIKKWIIEDNGIFVELHVEVGLKGNEAYCSDRLHVFIEKKGDVKMCINKNNKYIIKKFTRMEFGDNNNINA